MFIEAL